MVKALTFRDVPDPSWVLCCPLRAPLSLRNHGSHGPASLGGHPPTPSSQARAGPAPTSGLLLPTGSLKLWGTLLECPLLRASSIQYHHQAPSLPSRWFSSYLPGPYRSSRHAGREQRQAAQSRISNPQKPGQKCSQNPVSRRMTEFLMTLSSHLCTFIGRLHFLNIDYLVTPPHQNSFWEKQI